MPTRSAMVVGVGGLLRPPFNAQLPSASRTAAKHAGRFRLRGECPVETNLSRGMSAARSWGGAAMFPIKSIAAAERRLRLFLVSGQLEPRRPRIVLSFLIGVMVVGFVWLFMFLLLANPRTG